jgi:hypothetical protein
MTCRPAAKSKVGQHSMLGDQLVMMVQCLMLISNCALTVELLSPSRRVFVYFILHKHFTLVNYVHR